MTAKSTDTAAQPLDKAGLEAATDAFIAKFHERPANSDIYRERVLEAIRAAISALPAAPMPGVKATVKALVWRENPLGNWVAQSLVGQYFVFKEDGVWCWVVVDISAWRNFATPEAAKADAQADYTQRILSALDVPAHPEGVKDDAKRSIVELVEMHKRLLIALEVRGRGEFVDYERYYHDWSNTVLNAMTVIGNLSALSHPEPVAQEAVALVWADEGELAIEWPGRAIISIEGGGIVSFATCDGEKWSPGKVNPFDRPADAAEQINAALRARVAELEASATPQAGASEAQPVAFKNGPVMAQFSYGQFLNWIADRMQHVHGENPNYDYMHRLREIADWLATPPDSDAVRALRRALTPFANLEDAAHGNQRYYIQLLICPEGDTDPKDWGSKIRIARATLSNQGSSSNGQ